ncbi:MAG: type II toxin-antitoxin system VapC family toxin [Desulfohalobiaceae bacterium]
MYIVDSCGWLEWLTDGNLAETYAQYLTEVERILIPSIVLYEVYKVLKREVGEEKALLAISYMKRATIVPLDDNLAIKAADTALLHNLAMADAVIYATAQIHEAPLYTSDVDFRGLPLVQWLE